MKNLTKFFLSGDEKIFYLLNKKLKCRTLDTFMPFITRLGGVIFTIIFPILLIVFGRDKMKIIGTEILISLSISHIFVQITKRIITRERPYNILKDINTFNHSLRDYSFPSGHTTASFSIATILSINIPYLMIALTSLATLVGISRVYLGVHYPSDVIVGIFFGTMTSILIHPYFIYYFI